MQSGKILDIEPFFVDCIKIPGLQNVPLRTLGRVMIAPSVIGVHHRILYTNLHHLWSGLTSPSWQLLWHYGPCTISCNSRFVGISWYMIMYIIESIERMQNIFVRKWLWVSGSLTDVALYPHETPCPLPFRSLVTLFQSTKVISHLQLQYSKDDQVKSTLTGHKGLR